jgi:hypothetical protein
MIIQGLLLDIHALEEELIQFERKYGLRSEIFYTTYIDGEEPENDEWVLDFGEWASIYKTWLMRQAEYHQIRLAVRERLDYRRLPVLIDWYGYEIWKGDIKLYWYDSQPHPNDFSLQSTHPHHKHIHPNIKHNRIPAPSMNFDKPNIPSLINEIEDLIRKEI